MELSIQQILTATGGRLLQGDSAATITDVIIDSRSARPASFFVPLAGTRADGHEYIAAARASGAASFVKAGHPVLAGLAAAAGGPALIEVADPLQALGDLAAYWRRRFPIKVVAITGSNGKTSTKEMAACILGRTFRILKNPGNFNNLIGLPLSLFKLDETHQVAILELGMSEPGEIDRLAEICDPDIGIITNVGPSHLEQLKTLERIAAAKGELFSRLEPQDTALINGDDSRVARLGETTAARTLRYGMAAGDVHASAVTARPDRPGMQFTLQTPGGSAPVRLAVPGNQFVINALAAAAIAAALGMGIADMAAGLEAFSGVPGRMETIELAGCIFINDAYNANPVSTKAALSALCSFAAGRRTIAALGDMLELGENTAAFHRGIGLAAAQLQVSLLFLTGEYARDVRDGAVQAGMSPEAIQVCPTIESLAGMLDQARRPGDVILLKGSRRMKMETVLTLLGQKESAPGKA